MTNSLTARRLETAKPGAVRQEIPDGLLVGLYFIVQPSGARSWAVRYRHAGKSRKHTLGPYPAVDLAAARDMGSRALRAAAEGKDPASDKRTRQETDRLAKVEADRGKRDLFENVAREFIKRHAMKSTKSWRETARILGLQPDPAQPGELVAFAGSSVKVLSLWTGRKVQAITKRDVISLLDSIVDAGSPVMANRTLAAVRKLFNWCVARDIIAVSPCIGVEPPGAEQSRDRILTDDEMRLVWKAAEAEGWPFGPLVKMLMLTGQRLGEVAGMRWDEIDLDAKLWTLPADRVKNGQKHEVPLSDAAIEILSGLPRIKTTKGFVFTTRRDAAVSGFSRAKDRLDELTLKASPDSPIDHWTFHDLRRTMASGMARLGIQLPVIEKILNHTSGTFRGVVGVYQRHSYSDEKRAALDAWTSFVQSIVTNQRPTNVVSLARGR